MAIKLDMEKAYNRLKYKFIQLCFHDLDFRDTEELDHGRHHDSSVVVNGTPGESFRPKRGIRQGDPISQYIFIICTRVL